MDSSSSPFRNNGREAHFAALARISPGRTFEDVRGVLAGAPADGPPSGPFPFEDVAAVPTTDPGTAVKVAVNLPAGDYAVYCLIPSPDGSSHAHKGMLKKLTVTEGARGDLPDSVGTVIGTDFTLTQVPTLTAGVNTVGFHNQGRQLHEMNLVELSPGKSVDDVVRWLRQPGGPPPMVFLGGVAVKVGEEGVAILVRAG